MKKRYYRVLKKLAQIRYLTLLLIRTGEIINGTKIYFLGTTMKRSAEANAVMKKY